MNDNAFGKLTNTLCFGIVLNCLFVSNLFAAGVTAKENLERLITTGKCVECDLTGLNLNRMDLSGTDLRNSDLSFTSCFLTNFSGADLRGTTLNGTVFGGADLGDADLRGADLRGADLESAYLGGTLMEGDMVPVKQFKEYGISDIQKDTFVADQRKTKSSRVPGAIKIGAQRVLHDPPPPLPAKLVNRTNGVDDVKPDGQIAVPPVTNVAAPVKKTASPPAEVEVVIKNTDKPVMLSQPGEVMETDIMAPLPQQSKVHVTSNGNGSQKRKTGKKVSVSPEKMQKMARLIESNKCYGCDLSGLDLSGLDLEEADLEKANLSDCNLTEADLQSANLKGADLRGADLSHSDLKSADLYRAKLEGARLTGADMKGTKLDDAEVSGAIGF